MITVRLILTLKGNESLLIVKYEENKLYPNF
jgi:hypothetical protein